MLLPILPWKSQSLFSQVSHQWVTCHLIDEFTEKAPFNELYYQTNNQANQLEDHSTAQNNTK